MSTSCSALLGLGILLTQHLQAANSSDMGQLLPCCTLQDTWAEVQAENTEKAMLGTGKDYDRQFP